MILLDFFYHVRNKDALHYLHVVMTYKYETRMSFREHNCNYICINYMYSIQVQTLKNTICMHIFSFLKQRRYYCVLLFKKILYTTVNARTTSLPERTYSSCNDFTSSGCSSTTSGTKLPDFR